MHFGAVVADAPSPLSTPRSAAGQAQLRLGKPVRMKCRASPVLLFNARRKSSLRCKVPDLITRVLLTDGHGQLLLVVARRRGSFAEARAS